MIGPRAWRIRSHPMSPDRHAILAIRNLTWRRRRVIEFATMSVITVKRMLSKRGTYRRSLLLRSFRELTKSYFRREKSWEFVIEALSFTVIVAISAWPIFVAADALRDFLQRPAGL